MFSWSAIGLVVEVTECGETSSNGMDMRIYLDSPPSVEVKTYFFLFVLFLENLSTSRSTGPGHVLYRDPDGLQVEVIVGITTHYHTDNW